MTVLAALVVVALSFATLVTLTLRLVPTVDPAAPGGPTAISRELRRIDRIRPALRRRVDPTRATGLALTVALALVLGGGVGLGVTFAMVREHQGLARADRWVAEWGAEHATALSTDVLRLVTDLGGAVAIVVLGIVIGALEYRRIPSRALVPFLVLVLAGQSALANGVKALVERARPDIEPLASFASTSFPSGHATAGAACYAAFALVLSRQRPRIVQTGIVAAAAAVAGAVAASRVLLGVHWLTDVVAGLALGWGWFAACSIAFGGRLLRFGAPVEAAERAEALTEVATDGVPPAAPGGASAADAAGQGRLDGTRTRVPVGGHPRRGSES
jgi:undecaprenyl-diphosphatase